MSKDEKLIAVFNFSNKGQNYPLNETKATKIIIHTDWERFGGKTKESYDLEDSSISLPPFSGLLLESREHKNESRGC